MKRTLTTGFSSLACKSEVSLLLVLFFLLLGISSGTFFELMLETEEKVKLMEQLNRSLLSQSFGAEKFPFIFINSMSNHLLLLLLFLLLGLSVVFSPLILPLIAYKGMALGFSCALLMESLSAKGLLTVFLTLVPQNLILLPTLLLASAVSLTFSVCVVKNRKTGIKKGLAQSVGPYLLFHFCSAFFLLLGCLTESFICPFLLQLIK